MSSSLFSISFLAAFFILIFIKTDVVLGNSETSQDDKFAAPSFQAARFAVSHEGSAWKEEETNDNYIDRQIPSLEDVMYGDEFNEEDKMNDHDLAKKNYEEVINTADRNLPGLQDILNENPPKNNNNHSPGGEISSNPGSNSVSGENGNFHPTLDPELMKIRDEIMRHLPEMIKEGVRKAEMILELQKVDENKTSAHISPSRKSDPESKRISECTGLSKVETMKIIVQRFHIPKDKIFLVLESLSIEPYHNDFRTKYCMNKKRKILVTPRMTCNPNDEYRTVTGMCNNLINPQLGASNTPFSRYLPPDYGDGFNSLRGDGGQDNLPSPRLVSFSMSSLSIVQNPSKDIHLTQMFKAWGQTIDHDCTFAPESDVHGCCDDGRIENIVNTDDCRPIIATGDPFYTQFGIECLRFTRSLPAATGNFGRREQFNSLTAFLDGSHVYGSTEGRENELRSFENGMLKENRMGEDGFCMSTSHCNMPFLPENPGGGLTNFFDAGDHRVNEQPGLTSMHTMLFRLHNHLAIKLGAKHPEYNDEKLFQETRRIVIAIIQNISYNEFLALLLGKKFMNDFGLNSLKSGYFTSYDSSIDPSIRNVFSAAAMRVGHTFITGIISGENSVNLETVFNDNTFMLSDAKMFPSNILKGECTNPAERYDVKLVDAITHKLFALPPLFSHGNDLMSLNIQRARDHGIPSYNNWRRFCGKNPFTSFDEMRSEMPPEVVDAFARIYQSVNDIDLFPAMLGEFRTTFGSVGDTFSCILSRQFHNLKFGDRFWYEGNSQPKPFSENQLGAIRRTSLASVICSTSLLEQIQPYPMLQKTLRRNEERPCSSYLPNTVFSTIDQFW